MSVKPNGIGIVGTGKFIPANPIENDVVERRAGMGEGLIQEQTGITMRYAVGEEDTATSMSVSASQQALNMANVTPDQLGLIVGCTFTADYIFPALACQVNKEIGADGAGSFDLMANCTAFQVGLCTGSDRMQADASIDYALVMGTAIVTRHLNWNDPSSAIYFGDGSGAAVLGRVPDGYGFMSHDIQSFARAYESVRLKRCTRSYENAVKEGLEKTFIEMNGIDVWKQVAKHQPAIIRSAVEKAGLELGDIDFFIFHQANLHLIRFLMGRLDAPMEKTHTNVERIGNTAEASIPIALCEAVEQGKIKHGDTILLSGVGAGFTFGATVMRWYDSQHG